MRYATVLFGIATLSITCSAERRAPPRSPADAPPTGPSTGSRRPSTPTRKDPDRSNVAISPDVKRACSIADSDAFFAYNSAQMRERDRTILRQLADCFTTGPLKGRTIELVAHGDPRGDLEYDSLLGQWRADNVKVALINAGASSGQIATISGGKDQPGETNRATSTLDGRVDVRVGK